MIGERRVDDKVATTTSYPSTLVNYDIIGMLKDVM